MGLYADFGVLFLAFGLIVILVFRRYDINIGVLAAVLVLLAYFSGREFSSVLWSTLADLRMWFLLSMSFSIALLALLYRETGFMDSLSRGLMRVLGGPRFAIIVIPAVIGLLPIAGGALMSAPMVGVLGEAIGLSLDLIIFLNVWFRHVLFMVYPLGQALVIAAVTTGFNPVELALIQVPIAIVMLLTGMVYLWNKKGVLDSDYSSGTGSFFVAFLPLLIAVSFSLLLNSLIGDFGMPLGIMIGVVLLYFLSRPGSDKMIRVFKNRMLLSLSLAAFSIMLLQHTIIDTRASLAIMSAVGQGFPLMLLETIIPGLISGLTSSPVTGIVIMAPIIASVHPLSIMDASLLYTSSFITYTISPTHLCLIYTAKYFRRGFIGTYKYFLPAAVITIVFTVFYYLLVFH